MLKHTREDVGVGVGRIPSGCAILTATHDSRSNAILASWIQQASFEPLAVTAAIKKGRPIADLVRGSGKFVLNVISQQDAGAFFKHFGKGFSLDQDPYQGLDVEPSEFGHLLKKAVAQLACEVLSRVDAGDHEVYVAEVVAGTGRSDQPPYVHVRKTGLSY